MNEILELKGFDVEVMDRTTNQILFTATAISEKELAVVVDNKTEEDGHE